MRGSLRYLLTMPTGHGFVLAHHASVRSLRNRGWLVCAKKIKPVPVATDKWAICQRICAILNYRLWCCRGFERTRTHKSRRKVAQITDEKIPFFRCSCRLDDTLAYTHPEFATAVRKELCVIRPSEESESRGLSKYRRPRLAAE